MEAPTGQRFRVIKPPRSDFDSRAHAWQEGEQPRPEKRERPLYGDQIVTLDVNNA